MRGSASRAVAVSNDVGRLRQRYALFVEQACRGAARLREQAQQDIRACRRSAPSLLRLQLGTVGRGGTPLLRPSSE